MKRAVPGIQAAGSTPHPRHAVQGFTCGLAEASISVLDLERVLVDERLEVLEEVSS
jgi:hypothetical protein